MARPRRVAAAAAVLLVACAAPAPAQGLRKLHVEALSMRADRAQVQVHQVFHLAIHVRVRENVAALDELVVPDVGTMQLEGDERRVSSAPGGTDVVETLTLEPVASGTYTFNPAYLDAIDARTGKPLRFSSNPVRVVVTGAPVPLGDGVWSAVRAVLATALVLVAVAAAVIVALAIVAARRRTRPAAKAVAPVAPPPAARPPAPPASPRDAVAAALRQYRAAPANGSLTALRVALFGAAGTNAGATLGDALAATSDRALRSALIAAERTAFGPAQTRDASSAELVDATEAWLR